MSFSQALARPPSKTFARGLTTAQLGQPDLELAQMQHAAYCRALRDCGLEVQVLEPEDAFPDSTFVEDAAIVLPEGWIRCRPGDLSRRDEPALLDSLVDFCFEIEEPGTLEGGDVCVAEDCLFIGITNRTNFAGARQLSEFARIAGYRTYLVDLSTAAGHGLLHLKTGITHLDDVLFIADPRILSCRCNGAHTLADTLEDLGFQVMTVIDEERYAANSLALNGCVLVPSGHPRTADQLTAMGRAVREVDMSEFQKMDGGLSCLSLRW